MAKSNKALLNAFYTDEKDAPNKTNVILVKESNLEKTMQAIGPFPAHTSLKAGRIFDIPYAPQAYADLHNYIVAIVPDEPTIYDLAFLANATNLDDKHSFKLNFIDDKGRLSDTPSDAGFTDEEMRNMLVGYGLANHRYQDSFAPLGISWRVEDKPTKKPKARNPKIIIPSTFPSEIDEITSTVEGISMIRDLINTPADIITPEALIEATENLAWRFNAHSVDTYFDQRLEDAIEVKQNPGLSTPMVDETVDEDALSRNFPAIHAVGKASEHKPGLIDFKWGDWDDENLPKITLVGKGVTYDTGGLNLKGASMKSMKKDMGGAAHVVGLSRIVMGMNLPVRLRVIIPAAENAIGPKATRPSDVIGSRKGKSIEVTNTDAEGRLILADALALASEDDPDLIINYATLTGGARTAYGKEAPALFAADTALGRALEDIGFDVTGDKVQHTRYDEKIAGSMRSSNVADLVNSLNSSFGSAIQAAVFLREFVEEPEKLVHIDTYAFNDSSRAGEPRGGADRGLRTIVHYLKNRKNAARP